MNVYSETPQLRPLFVPRKSGLIRWVVLIEKLRTRLFYTRILYWDFRHLFVNVALKNNMYTYTVCYNFIFIKDY